jgi:AraC family transcriptional regulator
VTTLRMGQFVGAPLRTQRFDGVALAENSYAADLRVGDHEHDAPLLSLVLRGTATEETRGISRALSTQTLLYTPAFATHAHRFLTASRWLNIQFTEAWFARFGLAQEPLPTRSQVVRGGAVVTWATRVRAELQRPDAISPLAIEGALLLLVAEVSRLPTTAERQRPRWLRIVEAAIDAGGPRPPSLAQLAALTGVHAAHLLRTFRRYHGTTIANYARQRRIERARTALATSGRSLAAIALEAGFADQSHFTKAFKQAFGETPGQYVRSQRGG